jgi:hypothetical protein
VVRVIVINGTQRNAMNAQIQGVYEELKLWWQQCIKLLAKWDLTKFQAAWFLLDWVNIYLWAFWYGDCWCHVKCKLRWVWTAWTFGNAVSYLAEDEMYVCFVVVCWYCLRVRCLAMYGLTVVMESYGSKLWFWTGNGPNLWYVKPKWKWNKSEYKIGCH